MAKEVILNLRATLVNLDKQLVKMVNPSRRKSRKKFNAKTEFANKLNASTANANPKLLKKRQSRTSRIRPQRTRQLLHKKRSQFLLLMPTKHHSSLQRNEF
jgi:hypothetical protein